MMTVRDEQNAIVLTQMRKHHGSGWWAAMPLAAECREALGCIRHTAARVIVDRALRRLRYRGLVESSGGGLWRAKPAMEQPHELSPCDACGGLERHTDDCPDS